MTRVPQLLESVRVASRPDLASAPALTAEIAAVEAELGEAAGCSCGRRAPSR